MTLILVSLDYSRLDGFGFFGMWGDLERLLGRPVDLVTEAVSQDNHGRHIIHCGGEYKG